MTDPSPQPAPTPGDDDRPDDVQTLLSRALARLAHASGCPRAAAWGRRHDGRPFVLAATPDAATPFEPDDALLDAVGGLPRATDLGAPGFPPALGERAARAGFAAGCPLGEAHGPVLLLGGPADPPGRVRAATLDALGAAAERLAPSVEAARASARLAAVGEEVRRLDALASLGQLVSELVHEIRNPLVSVKTFLQLLPERADDPDFRTEFLEVVGDEVRRIERLLDLVLEQAHPESRAVGEAGCEAGPVLDSVVRLLAHRAQERGVALRAEAASGTRVPIHADALHQVVLNLAMNALDATPEGGGVRLLAVEAEGAARIACDDEGPGVPPELRDRIFEPFFSTKRDRPGGLGLAIARRMVLESGGTISVEDRPGGGTRIALAWAKGG